jgi:DNA-binding NarL/FixJ family response regulator
MTLAARAALLRGRCSGCRTPILDEREASSPLTPRERQIAWLAVQGLTNREIGARLGISRRTVETHLVRTYDKLGVADRAALGAALPARGPA